MSSLFPGFLLAGVLACFLSVVGLGALILFWKAITIKDPPPKYDASEPFADVPLRSAFVRRDQERTEAHNEIMRQIEQRHVQEAEHYLSGLTRLSQMSQSITDPNVKELFDMELPDRAERLRRGLSTSDFNTRMPPPAAPTPTLPEADIIEAKVVRR